MTAAYYGWSIFLGSRPYAAALEWQKRMVRYRQNGSIRDTLFYFEHPDVITLGRDCKKADLSKTAGVEVHRITRGGGVTYHGPGQLVLYPVFDLARRGRDLHKFIHDLEEGIIQALAGYGLTGERRPKYTGVWIGGRKIASIGVAVAQWISYHGAAINLTTDLAKFNVIDPCGLPPETMTSLQKEAGKQIPLTEFAGKLSDAYAGIFDTVFQEIDLEELNEIVRLEESTQSL
ncbi:MAG: lipoyl(octanoyl) transferase LipB [candidate division Zixibacteria bacterium]|nr:lipoyl(octanoyl) transferase LipB [candidate division Zixibacteria bacterium]